MAQRECFCRAEHVCEIKHIEEKRENCEMFQRLKKQHKTKIRDLEVFKIDLFKNFNLNNDVSQSKMQ